MKYIILIFNIFFLVPFLFSYGLKTEFSELLLENLQAGRSYSFTGSFNYPFYINYTGEEITKIDVIPAVPKKYPADYTPVPDLKWVTITPNNFIVSNDQTVCPDIKIKIPDKKKYVNKKYAVAVKILARPAENGFLGTDMSLNSTILFTTVKNDGLRDVSERQKSNGSIFSVEPENIYITNYFSGKHDKRNTRLSIINNDDQKHTYKIKVLKMKETTTRRDEDFTDIPDIQFIKIDNDLISVEAKRSGEVKYSILFPKIQKYFPQKYALIIAIEDQDSGIAYCRYAKIFIFNRL